MKLNNFTAFKRTTKKTQSMRGNDNFIEIEDKRCNFLSIFNGGKEGQVHVND